MKIDNQLKFILGPCSAEDQNQVATIAQEVRSIAGFSSMRAGVWKPRTRPGSFEGSGELALDWLASVQQNYDVPVSIEVASAQHVDLALSKGIKHLWIGARSTGNPFSVQDIADALQGVSGVTVMVKNPLVADFALWLGALERVERSIGSLPIAIHRGFTPNYPGRYRNDPLWDQTQSFFRDNPELEGICDISHIGGARDSLKEIAYQAIEIGFKHFMIETHPNPDLAKSDPKQQIFLSELKQFCDDLQLFHFGMKERDPSEDLGKLRIKIDELDREVVRLLGKRRDVVDKIVDIKVEMGLRTFSEDRYHLVMEHWKTWAAEHDLPEELGEKLYREIHQDSVSRQYRLRDQ